MNNQIRNINLNHSFIFFISCNIFSLIIFKLNNFYISPLFCLILILIVGVSHGSLDHLKGKKLLKIFNIENILFFYLSYILIAIGIMVTWVLIPTFSLIVFLLIASFHFGKEDTEFLITKNSYLNQLLYLFKGTLIVLAPLYFHFEDTISIFKLLLVENESFYETLNFIEANKILHIGIAISTLSSVYFFIKRFEFKKIIIF